MAAPDLAELVRDGTFDWRKHQTLLASSDDLPEPAFAALQSGYRAAVGQEQRRAIAREFEIHVRQAHVDATRGDSDRPPCDCPACKAGHTPFTVDHFRAWAIELELDNGEPWIVEEYFEAFLGDYFAGIPEAWLVVPEGNGKTTNLAGLALYLLEHRPNPSIPWAASSRDQAEIGYRQAEGFVLRSPRLRQIFKCQEGYRRVKHLVHGGRLQIFAADDGSGDGIIPTDAFLDELHRHKDLKLYRTWSGKLAKRGGQMATISTAGEPGSEFEDTRERIRQQTPEISRRPGFVHCRSVSIALHEHAVDPKANVEDMAVVKQANPASFITEETLAARRASPTMTVPHWRRFVCNLATRSEFAAVNEAEWAKAMVRKGRGKKLDGHGRVHEIPAGEPVSAGLDVAWKWDTTALVPLWMPEPRWRLLGLAAILEPPRDGSSLDPHLVEQAIATLHERNPLEVVVMDTSRAEQLASWIEEEFDCVVIDRQQTNTLAALDYARFMEGLREGWLRHVGDPGLTRHVFNAIARQLPSGGIRFDRPVRSRRAQQDRRVIDALTAASMVHSHAVAELDDGDGDILVAFG